MNPTIVGQKGAREKNKWSDHYHGRGQVRKLMIGERRIRKLTDKTNKSVANDLIMEISAQDEVFYEI